jgi:hypothetical protein
LKRLWRSQNRKQPKISDQDAVQHLSGLGCCNNMIAVVKLYIEGTGKPFCEINMNRTNKKQLATVIGSANRWLQVFNEQVGTPKKDLACKRCADLISILKQVLKVKNINQFPNEKATITELIKNVDNLQAKVK